MRLTVAVKLVGRFAALPSLVGPLFTKELRVTSRRGRYYVLRFGYAAALSLFIFLVWLGLLESVSGRSAAYRAVEMTEMGKRLIHLVVWFQFCSAQLVAVVLLSTAISEEIYQRTLVPILTTPMRYWQIVVGKFLGKLVHVILLLAVSVPLLAIARVMGGVPWGFVAAGVGITMTAAALAGSVSLFFSILCRRAFLSILGSIGVILGVYLVLGGVLMLASALVVAAAPAGWAIVLYPNPLAAMIYQSVALMDPSVRVAAFFWPGHCLTVLAMAGLVLKFSEMLLRRSAIRKAFGADPPLPAGAVRVPVLPVLMPADPAGSLAAGPPAPAIAAGAVAPAGAIGGAPPPVLMPVADRTASPAEDAPDQEGPPRRRRWRPRHWDLKEIIVSPIIWRELRKPLLRDRIVQIVVLCAVLFYLVYTYAILGAAGALSKGGVQGGFLATFLLAGMLCIAVDSATTIAPEKQARTWPALLSTPVSDWHILLGKAGGSLFRCLIVWLFLIGHVLFFSLIGFLHPLAIVSTVLLVAAMSMFLSGLGVYFSVRCRRTTTAILGSVGTGLLLWLILPVFLDLLTQAFAQRWLAILRDLTYVANPVVQAGCMAVAATKGSLVTWATTVLFSGYVSPFAMTGLVFMSSVGYSLLGVLLAWRAKRLFRRNVFEA